MKALLVATVQSHICQFHRPLARMLHERGCEVHVAARNNLAEKNGLRLDFADAVHDVCFARSPFDPKNLRAYRQLRALLAAEHYDFVHCNTPVGGVLTRLAAGRARRAGTVVLYTAHGFHFYRGAPLKNWLLFYPVEKLLARRTDRLITITAEDCALARRRFRTRVFRIHGVGADEKRFFPADAAALRAQLGYCHGERLILCVGELLPNKNQKTLLRAMPAILERVPGARLLIAGNGPELAALQTLTAQMQLSGRVEFLGYRPDVQRYTQACDVLASCSYREGLPLNVLEAMLCQKPVVASRNRGHRELVRDGETGFLLEPDDAAGFAQRLTLLLTDGETRAAMGAAAALAAQPYTARNVEKELEAVYFGREGKA